MDTNMNWDYAEEKITDLIADYEELIPAAQLALPRLQSLKTRLDNGERTEELYKSIIDAS